MSPKGAEEPPRPPAQPGRGSIPERVARRLVQRAQAFAEATSRPEGKPWARGTYGAGVTLTDKERKDRAKAIRDRNAALKRAAEGDEAQE